MSSWPAREIQPIEGVQKQFAHVIRHLYRFGEHWEQVIEGMVSPREAAGRAGCAKADLDEDDPDYIRVSRACRDHVLQDHDLLYAPAYFGECLSAERAGRRGVTSQKKPATMFVGDDGVLVVVQETGPERQPMVKTAYRVRPKRGRSKDDFFKAAVRKLQDKTSWTQEAPDGTS